MKRLIRGDHRAILRLAIAHIENWANELDDMVEDDSGNIGMSGLDNIVRRLFDITADLSAYEAKCTSRIIMPVDYD